MDPFLLSCELELQCCWGDYFQDFEGANPVVVKLLHWAVSGVILCIEPDFLSNLELWDLLVVSVIVLGQLICCMGQGGFASSCICDIQAMKVSAASTVDVWADLVPILGC